MILPSNFSLPCLIGSIGQHLHKTWAIGRKLSPPIIFNASQHPASRGRDQAGIASMAQMAQSRILCIGRRVA